MRTLFCAILCVFALNDLQSQDNIDSLWNIWIDEDSDLSQRLKSVNQIIWNRYLFKQPDSAIVLADRQFELAEQHNQLYYMGKALNNRGIANSIMNRYPEAIRDYEAGSRYMHESGDTLGLSEIMSNIGIVYKQLGDYETALEYYFKNLSIREHLRDSLKIASVLINIAGIYYDLEEYKQALDQYEKALYLIDSSNFTREPQETDQLKSVAQEGIGAIYARLEQYETALEYHHRSYELDRSMSNMHGMAYSLEKMGIVYGALGDYQKAQDLFQHSLDHRLEMGDKQGITLSNINLGFNGIKTGSLDRAIAFCKNGLALSHEINYLKARIDACRCLYQAYKHSGDKDQALYYFERMSSAEDSLKLEQSAKKLQRLEFSRKLLLDSLERAKRQYRDELAFQVELNEKRRDRNMALAGGSLVLLLALGLWHRLRYTNRAKFAIEREKERSDALLLNILPAEVAEELKETGRARAQQFEQVSVLFTDFVNFTGISEEMDPSELVDEINRCFEAFDAIVERYGIEKIKTIGDAYMAAGGLPVPNEEAAKHTVLAALEMRDCILDAHSDQSASSEVPVFEMRLGIHTGVVVAGVVGKKKFQYDIWGDTVNTASRMEHFGDAGRVNISTETYELIREEPEFNFVKRDPIEVKGKGSIQMYFVDWNN